MLKTMVAVHDGSGREMCRIKVDKHVSDIYELKLKVEEHRTIWHGCLFLMMLWCTSQTTPMQTNVNRVVMGVQDDDQRFSGNDEETSRWIK